MEQITDHEARAVARMLSQFRGKPRAEAVTGLLGARAQVWEDALWALLDECWIDTAEGAQLDQWGLLLDLVREESWTDERYRALLQAQLLVLRSTGTGDELLEILRRLAETDLVRLREYFPAQVGLRYDAIIYPDDPGWALDIVAFLQRAAAAGVSVRPVEEVHEDTLLFSTEGRGFNQGRFGTRLA